jgi:hypothetical protein
VPNTLSVTRIFAVEEPYGPEALGVTRPCWASPEKNFMPGAALCLSEMLNAIPFTVDAKAFASPLSS